MPKTKDAFALRDFDAERILSRNFFYSIGYGSKNAVKDDRILDDLNIEYVRFSMFQSEFHETEKIKVSLEKLDERLELYEKKLLKHYEKLWDKFVTEISLKIANSADSADILKEKYRRAHVLQERYWNIIQSVNNLQEKTGDLWAAAEDKIEEFYRNEFAYLLKVKRKRSELTQQELAKISGIPKTDISQFETGRKVPAFYTMIKLAKALDCSIDDLIFGT